MYGSEKVKSYNNYLCHSHRCYSYWCEKELKIAALYQHIEDCHKIRLIYSSINHVNLALKHQLKIAS